MPWLRHAKQTVALGRQLYKICVQLLLPYLAQGLQDQMIYTCFVFAALSPRLHSIVLVRFMEAQKKNENVKKKNKN